MDVPGNEPAEPRQSARAPLLLALDRSRAMDGDPISHARAGISGLLDRLSPDDRIGLVIFNGKVTHPAPLAPVRDGQYLKAVLGQIEPRLGANIGAALEHGVAECLADGATQNLVLISPGLATEGLRRRDQLERAAARGLRQGVRTSTIAIGAGADLDLLAAIAAAGGGLSTAVDSADGITRELDRLGWQLR